MIKLNLGCGNSKVDGFIGVDRHLRCSPDVCHDLEIIPYPFDDDSVEYIVMNHLYEHIGNAIGMMGELYRICKDGAIIEVTSPYYTWQGAYSDPTHVRYVTKDSFIFYDATATKMDGTPMTDGEMDFETIESYPIIDASTWQIRAAYFKLKVHKPHRN